MRRLGTFGLIAVLTAVGAGAGHGQPEKDPKAAVPDKPTAADRTFTGKAARITRKGPDPRVEYPAVYVEDPQVRLVGGQPFVGGRSVGMPGSVWVPVSDAAMIEEFADTREMGKVYRLPGDK